MAQFLDNLKLKLKKTLDDFKGIGDYFNPETNSGNNFWSSKTAQVLGKIDNPQYNIFATPEFKKYGAQPLVGAVKGAIKITPAYMGYKTATRQPVSGQDYVKNVVDVAKGVGAATLGPVGYISSAILGAAFNPKNPIEGAWKGIELGQQYGGLTRLTTPFISAALPQTLLTKSGLSGRVIQGALNVSENTIQNIATKRPAFEGTRIALVTGVAGRPFGGKIKLTKSNFTLDNFTRKEVEQAEDMILNPKNWVGKIKRPSGIRTEKELLKYIQSQGEHSIDVISAKYLPTKQLETLKTSGARIKALIDLSAQNRLGNFPTNYLVEPTKGAESTPKAVIRLKTKPRGGDFVPVSEVLQQPSQLSRTAQTQHTKTLSQGQAFDDIIADAKRGIGRSTEDKSKTIRQTVDDLYTQWVDRYNPITKVTNVVKKELKSKGAELRPEFDPTYQVRRLTGAGGIADYRFRTELDPIIKEMDSLRIDRSDMDVYLANKRIAGFGEVGRKVYGADPLKAKQVVNALEAKYGEKIQGIAERLYQYQDEGFQQMVDAGFISPKTAKVIKGQNPDYAPLQRVMDEVNNYLGIPTRKAMQGSQPILKLKGSKRQVESPLENIIANTFKQRAAIEKNNVARSIAGLQDIADIGFKKVAKSGNDTITVWKNGQKEYWQVGEEIANVAKGLNEENMNALLKIFTVPASILRQGATGRNPEFMIPNIVRDQLDAGITSKYGYIPFIDYLSGLKSMLADDEIYRKWQSSGAKIDLGEMSGRKNISLYMSEKTGKKNLFNWLSGALDVMGKYTEQPTRVGLFKKAYKKTGNELLAMMESREATVDFARMGSKMKVANSIIPFLNVGVQGFDKLIRAVKNQPGKVLLNASIYGALPAITTTLYNLVNYPEEYTEIPQYEKDSNFVLVKGRNENGTVDYVTIPKGNVLPVITNPIQSFLEFVAGTSQQTLGEFATQFISSSLPVVGEGQSLKEVALKTVGSNLPQLIKPITENLVNKSFYKYDTEKEETRDIVPFYLKDKEPYKQAYKFTPTMYKTIGAVLNISPLQVQNFLEGYLAGYSKIPAQMVEIAKNLSEGKEIEPNQKTILRRFIKQTYSTSGSKTSQVEKERTPLLERVFGKTRAGNENIILYEKNGKEYELDLGKTFTTPQLGSNDPFDKEAVSRYKNELSNQVNKIYDAYLDGKLSEERAREEIVKLQNLYDLTAKSAKGKKNKKVSIKSASTQLKPIKIQSTAGSALGMPKVKLAIPETKGLQLSKASPKSKLKVKIKTLPKTKLKILKS